MTPSELKTFLTSLVENDIRLSTMIWGAPGVGKSSIVQQIAEAHGIGLIDLRLSQLAPTDLRGLPVPKENISTWLPPEFLPTEGSGILFLDEINMAPPAMQGMAQQLILDRKVGSYHVPDGWFVWAAGNRKEDRAAVFDMPSPLANRFIHLEVEVNIDNFRFYAFQNNFHQGLIAFIAFRQELLHKMNDTDNAWPSPRSWEMANLLHSNSLDIAPAVGIATAAEFYAFLDIIDKTPDLDGILSGKKTPDFPGEASLRYATVMGLVGRVKQSEEAVNGFRWLVNHAAAEWVQLYATDLFPLLREKEMLVTVQQEIMQDSQLKDFLLEFAQLMAS